MENRKLFRAIDEILSDVISFRRHLHQFPELSFNEEKTSQFISNILQTNNIIHRRICNTGILAEIGTKKPSFVLRADIDALPIQEETDLEFASKNQGVMHACGHDIHTAILLGTAILLKKFENRLNAKAYLLFQPGEEKIPGGAKQIIETGVFEKIQPKAIFGQHIEPHVPVGKILISSGKIMASADELYWTLKGKGSHAAQPHLGNDLILTAAQLISNLNFITNKFKNPLDTALISITAISGGSATNVFPSEVKIMGTLRTFNNQVRFELLEKIRHSTENICNLFGAKGSFEPLLGYPPLQNNPEVVNFVTRVANELLGNENVLPFEPKLWAEDFAYYSELFPSAFWFIGAKNENAGDSPYGLHSSKFNPSEEALRYGIAIFSKIAFSFE